MREGRGEERKISVHHQFELAEHYFLEGFRDRSWLDGLVLDDRKLLFEELKSHQTLHVAQGNEAEAAQLLDGLGHVSLPEDNLTYKFQRLVINENERRGLGGRAREGMAQLYHAYRRSRTHRARSAEVVMEYGILQDRYGDKEEALKLFKHSVSRYERSGHQYNLAAAWFNSASVLYDLKKIKASIRACEKGLSLGGSEHLDLKTHLLLQRANCREKTRELELATEDYLEAAKGYEKLGRRRQQCNILFRVGWLYGRQNKLLDARGLLHSALKIAKELDYASGLADFHLKRAQFFLSIDCEKTRLEQHLQHAIMYSKLARLDKVEKVARGCLYRSQIEERRPLSFYLRARAPEADPKSLAKAGQGTYSHRVGDGYATRVWRSAPRSAGKDVTFLAKLLAELGRKAHREDLLRQAKAVEEWQRSVRQGRRIL